MMSHCHAPPLSRGTSGVVPHSTKECKIAFIHQKNIKCPIQHKNTNVHSNKELKMPVARRHPLTQRAGSNHFSWFSHCQLIQTKNKKYPHSFLLGSPQPLPKKHSKRCSLLVRLLPFQLESVIWALGTPPINAGLFH